MVGGAVMAGAAATTKLVVTMLVMLRLLTARTVNGIVPAATLVVVDNVKVEFEVAFPEKPIGFGKKDAVTPEGSELVMDNVTVLLPGLPLSLTLTV